MVSADVPFRVTVEAPVTKHVEIDPPQYGPALHKCVADIEFRPCTVLSDFHLSCMF